MKKKRKSVSKNKSPEKEKSPYEKKTKTDEKPKAHRRRKTDADLAQQRFNDELGAILEGHKKVMATIKIESPEESAAKEA